MCIDRQDVRSGIEHLCFLRQGVKVNRNNLHRFDSVSYACLDTDSSGRDTAVGGGHGQVIGYSDGDLVSHVAVPIMMAGLPRKYSKPWRDPGLAMPADTLRCNHLTLPRLFSRHALLPVALSLKPRLCFVANRTACPQRKPCRSSNLIEINEVLQWSKGALLLRSNLLSSHYRLVR
ncbi:hypothetical protein D3C78_1374010 [compost metagenome]